MALDIINDQNDPNKKDQPGASQQPQAGAPAAQPGSANNTTGQGPQAQSARPKAGSGFVNLQNIISKNKNNQLGSTINQGVQGQAQSVRQGITSNQELFNQEMQKNAVGTEADQQHRQDIINRVTGYQAPTGNVNTTGQGPNAQPSTYQTGAVPQAGQQAQQAPQPGNDLVSDQDATDFAKYRAGLYNGPQSLRDADDLAAQAQNAQQLGQNVGTSGGRQALLQQFVGKRAGYGGGKQALDSLILGQTGAQDLQNARKATVGLGSEVQNAESEAEQKAAATASIAKQFGQDTTNLLGGANTNDKTGTGLIGNIYSGLNTDLTNKQASADKNYQDFQNRLANKQLTQEDVEKYINPLMGGNQLFGLSNADLAKAFTENKFGLEDVADNTKAAKLNALQKLAGKNDVQLDASKIGAKKNEFDMSDSQFKDYQKKQQDYQNAINPYNQIKAQTQERLKQNKALTDELSQKFKTINPNDTLDNIAKERQDIVNETLKNHPELSGRQDLLGVLQNSNNYSNAASSNADADNGRYDQMPDFNQLFKTGEEQRRLSQSDSVLNALNTKYGVNGSIEDLMGADAKKAYEAAHPQAAPQMIANTPDFYKFSDPHFDQRFDTGGGNTVGSLFSGEGLHNVQQWGNGSYDRWKNSGSPTNFSYAHGGVVKPHYARLTEMMKNGSKKV